MGLGDCMNINQNKKQIEIKIVYYGCGMSGKTTSLKYLFRYFNKEDRLKSIETTSGRTLFFDFGILPIKGGEWTVKLLIYSATGQDFYASTRPSTLQGADGIIFIYDSQKNCTKDNLRSWMELGSYYGPRLKDMPMVISMNKQDLGNVVNRDEVVEILCLENYGKTKIIETIATEGNGVIITFKSLLSLLFPSASLRH